MILNSRFNLDNLRISFIKDSLSNAKEELKSIIFNTFTKNWKQKQYQLKDCSELSSFVSESDSKIIQCLLWQPHSIDFDFVVFLTNMSDGWMSLIEIYFNKYNREVIQVAFSDAKSEYPFYSFEYRQNCNHRLVRSMKDSEKWDFFETGYSMQFENNENYKKRKIADRMNNYIITDYLKKNGIDIDKNNFWMSRGDAIEFSTNLLFD